MIAEVHGIATDGAGVLFDHERDRLRAQAPAANVAVTVYATEERAGGDAGDLKLCQQGTHWTRRHVVAEGDRDLDERLQLSPLTVANMLRAGTVPGFKLGHLWRVRAADLDAFIVERAEAGKVKAQAKKRGGEKRKS